MVTLIEFSFQSRKIKDTYSWSRPLYKHRFTAYGRLKG